MAKQLNVDLRFTANNTQAKQQIQDLQTALDKLMLTSSKSSSGLGITKDIAQATSEVAKLQAMLESSKNASGGLDLGKFNQSLAQGQVKISDYAKTLSSLGPQGDQAFAKLAKAIINAEVPLKRTNSLLKEFKTSLANTARWQLSSSMLHGFMGAVQSAYGYAQDLNESLNNIRIVTGQNIEQMATFAKEANKAAQALSTTTTEYTDASLIYYQQGLSDSEVAKRTEVTIKMANAAGQSAQIISDQLTAVWNNFYDGSKSLEYYADVMTALGAATASSTDEIAGGLEKFAAIGETIGLSYEYAASALATITSNTRQSEEVVGTALKTIFARIQGLNLGETLDDGTSLNKYSAALEKIGINIFEQNGEIKKMDRILDEMAAKWGTLAKDQQIALAQTVAGVRQYTQLIALMDNWDAGDSDSMVANLDTSYNATGALQEQADIYAESWEAARDRVTAAAEEIYNQLLNDEFFIDLNNGFAGFLNIVSNTIDALGGLPGVLTVASSIMFRMFGSDMAKTIDDWGYNIKLRSNEGVQEILKLRQESVEALKNLYADNVDTGPVNATSQTSFESQAAIADTLLVKRQQLLANGQALSEQDERQAQLLLKINEAYGEQAIESAKTLENAQRQSDLLESQVKTQIRRYNKDKKDDEKIDLKAEINEIKQAQIQYSALESTLNKLSRAKGNFKSGDDMIAALKTMADEASNAGMDVSGFHQVLSKLSSGMTVDEVLNAIETEMYEIGDAAYNNIEKLDGLREKLQQIGMSDEQINKLIASWEKQGIITSEVAENLRNIKVQGDEATEVINKMQGPPPTVGQKFMAVANTISNIAMSISAVKGLIDTWNNDDMSFGEKLLSTFTTLGMVIPMVTTALSSNNLALLGSASSSIVAAAGFKGVDIAAKMAAGGIGALWAALWPIALVAAAVAAAIAILVVTIKAISNAYNADAIAAEQAEKAARNLADAYNEVKQEYQDMIAAMDNYKSARDALDNLTEGTKEYEAALKEANRAALELINKYSLIEKQDYDWEGNRLIIKDDTMDQVSSAKEAEMDQAYAASQMASVSARTERSKADLTDMRREIRDDNGLGNGDRILLGIANGISAALGVALAPVTGGLSLAATALAAGITINADMQAAKMDAVISKAVEEAKDNQNLFDTKEVMAKALNIDLNDTDLIDALWANQEEIKGLADEMNAAEAAWKLAAQNSANEILNNNKAVKNSENAEDVMAAGGNMYSIAYEDAYNKYLADAKDRGLFNTGTDASKKAFEDYAKKAGLNDLKNFKVTNYKGDGTVEYKYIDDQGQEKKVLATAEEIAATLAAAEAADKLGVSAENLVKVFNALDASGKAYDQAMKSFLSTGNFENGTREEAIALVSKVDSSGDGSINSVEASSYLGNQFGGTDRILSKEEAKQYGYESAQAMIEAFTKELNNIDEAWESIKLPDNIAGLDKMSLKTAQAFENSFNEINLGPASEAGKSAGAEFVEGINKMVAGLSEEDQTKALEQLSTVDWSSWDALEQADAIMKEFGVDIDTTSKEWADYAKNMRIASGATPDFSKLRDTLTSITSILQDLDFGSVISDEDYQKLVEYNDEWERFFMLQADGSQVFIGDAQTMQRETRADIIAQREALQARKKAQAGFENANWGHRDENNSWVEADWGNKSGSDTGTATNLMKASGATEDMLEQLGYTDKVIQDMITKATSSQADLVAEGEAALREMYRRIDAFTEEELAEMDAQFDEMMASTATNVDDLKNLLDSGQTSETAYDKQLSVLANNASSLEELQRIRDTGTITGEDGTKIGLDTQEYGQALLNLADSYSNCTEEAEAYSKALTSGNEATIKAAREALEASIEVGELAEKYDLNSEQLEDYAKRLKDLHKDSNLSLKDATKLATANMRLDRGMSNLNDNLEDYKKALDKSNEGSAEWSNTLSDLKTDLADMLNVADGSMLSDKFAQDILASEDLKLALDGDTDAILRLRLAAADDIIANLDVDDTALANVQTQWQYLKDNMAEGVAAGDVDQTRLIASFNEMIKQGNMTKEQIEAALSGLHVSANVKTTYVSQKQQVPLTVTETSWLPSGTMTVPVPDGNGGTKNETYTSMRRVTRTYDAGTSEADVVVPQYEIEGTEGPGNITTAFNALPAPSVSKSSTTTGKTPSSSGSTPSAPSKAEKRDTTSKSDVSERYREVADSIDNVTDALTRAERATARLWGKDKLDAMRQENKILAEQYKLLQQKAKEAKYYAKQDYNDLMDVADELGVSVVVDAQTGDITNIEEVEELLYGRLAAAEGEYNRQVEDYNAAVEDAGDSPTEAKVKELETMKDALDAYEKDIIGGIEDDISAWEDAEQTFQNSVETWEDAGLEAEDILDQMMQKNFDIWSESLQLEVEVNDRDLELLDYYLSKIEDDVYQMAEAAALMVGNLNSGFEGGQLGEYLDNLSIYSEKYAELTDRLNSTDPEYQITSAQYKEGLEEIQSGLLDNLSSVQELDTVMMEYYGETLSMVGEEIDKYSEKMEHQTSILEHYATMMDILGKSQDYEAMGTILEGQVETIKNELDVAEAEYNLYASEAEKKRKLYEEAVAEGDTAAAELYKGEWEAAEEAALEAQSNMLDKTEQWAEAMKAAVENKLHGLAKSLEEALTGGTSFDQITTQMERAASLQEEYLTTTNQIYETNKLMRTAQQEIDKSTNTVAKQRLKDFIKETDQLQDKSKLSKYELEIQQAKYDLLLAEIALEEAQNAKSTVRLQKDSEGNFGYVYTADQNQMTAAQQELEDAQNRLYNIGLEGANGYAEKYSQTMQEMYDTLTSITEAYYNGEIASQEEYEEQMLAAQNYYYEQLENYQDLYGVALNADTRVIKDAWSSSFNSMINNTNTWKDKVKLYSDEAALTLAGWYEKVDTIANKTGLDNIASKVKTVTDESKALKDMILGTGGEDTGVIGALTDELTAVSNLTGGYANLRTTIQGLITDYENLLEAVNKTQNSEQAVDTTVTENNDNGNTDDTNDGQGGSVPGGSDPTADQEKHKNSTLTTGTSVTVKTTATHFSRDGGNGTKMRSFVPGGTYSVFKVEGNEVLIGRGNVATGWVRKTDLVGFDTGGYTGSWGSYGKLAVLDEKELVLNKNDTANFLASMEVLERILEIIDLQSASAQLGGVLTTPHLKDSTTSVVEQNVRIEAAFPAVTDRNEIEEAFNTLINTASQYANRR